MWPSILAPGNLPELARRHRLTYRLCTTTADRARLEAMPSFAAIADLVRVEFVTDLLGDSPDTALHMRWYYDENRYALEHDAIYLCLWPDVAFTESSLGHAADAIDLGKAGAVLPTLRVVSETCAPDLLSRPVSHGQALALSAGDVVRLAVRHLHPLSATTLAHAPHGKPGMSMIFRVPGEGLIALGATTWLFIDPALIRFTPDGDIVADADELDRLIHVASDSDDMFFLSLAPLWKDLDTFIPEHPNDVMDIARMTNHPMLAGSPSYEAYERFHAKLHYGPMTATLWSKAERRADRVFRSVVALRAYLAIWRIAREHGCLRAAQVMSLALHTTPIARRPPRGARYTVLLPCDRAFATAAGTEIDRQLRRRSRKGLVRAMLEHVVLGTDLPTGGMRQLPTAAGTTLTVREANGRRTIGDDVAVLEDFVAGRHRICIVDGFVHAGSPRRR